MIQYQARRTSKLGDHPVVEQFGKVEDSYRDEYLDKFPSEEQDVKDHEEHVTSDDAPPPPVDNPRRLTGYKIVLFLTILSMLGSFAAFILSQRDLVRMRATLVSALDTNARLIKVIEEYEQLHPYTGEPAYYVDAAVGSLNDPKYPTLGMLALGVASHQAADYPAPVGSIGDAVYIRLDQAGRVQLSDESIALIKRGLQDIFDQNDIRIVPIFPDHH